MAEPPLIALPRKVMATRGQAREFVAAHPDVSPTFAVYLDCRQAPSLEAADLPDHLAVRLQQLGLDLPSEPGVEILSPTFADEVLKAWPLAQLIGANPDVAESWQYVVQRRTTTRIGWSRSASSPPQPDLPPEDKPLNETSADTQAD